MTYSAKLSNVECRHVGVVGVDSGQLIIMDPSYIESHWVKDTDAETTGLRFWGAGEDTMAETIRALGYEVLKDSRGCHYIIGNNHEVDLVKRVIEQHLMEDSTLSKMVVYADINNSTYNRIGDITLSNDKAGGLHYDMGHPGFAVAFSSGLGDGVYDVFVTYADIDADHDSGSFGRRIIKVEIELIVDEE